MPPRSSSSVRRSPPLRNLSSLVGLILNSDLMNRRLEPLRHRRDRHADVLRETRHGPTLSKSHPRQGDRGPAKCLGISDLAADLALRESPRFGSQTPDLVVHRCTSSSWWGNDALRGPSLTRRGNARSYD